MAAPNANLPYQHQSYPKFLFHATEGSKLVADSAAKDALGPGWFESPGEAAAAAVPVAPPDWRQPAPTVTGLTGTSVVTSATALAGDQTLTTLEQEEADGLYRSSVTVVLQQLAGAKPDVLERVKRIEEQNPKGARVTITRHIDEALHALKG